ncbi:MAG: hypothetical protein ABIE55_04375 [Candidatus Aenigmatarchaeota archaeon]
MKKKMDMHYYYAKKKMLLGVGIFLFGLIKYLGYSWEQAIMVLGILVFLKGVLIKMKSNCC